jgi:hypothetical protein
LGAAGMVNQWAPRGSEAGARSAACGVEWADWQIGGLLPGRTGTKDAWEPGSPTAHRFVIAIEGTGLTGPGQPLGAAGEQQRQSVTERWADRQAGIGKWTARFAAVRGSGREGEQSTRKRCEPKAR